MKASPEPCKESIKMPAPGRDSELYPASAHDLDNFTQLAAQVAEAPIAFITVLQANRLWLQSATGFTPRDTGAAISFYTHALLQGGNMFVPDTLTDIRFNDNPLVAAEPFIRSYAGIPILSGEGKTIGIISILDPLPRILTGSQVTALEVLARQVQTMLELNNNKNFFINAAVKSATVENELNRVLEKLGDNLWEHDFRTGATIFSRSAYHLLGFSENDFTDNKALWWQCIHPDDLCLLEENDLKCRAGITDTHCLQYRMLHKDGSVKWVLDRGVVTEKSPAGLPLKLVGTHTDITQCKQTEDALNETRRRWEFAIDGSGDGIWDWNLATNKVFYSGRWKNMLGYAQHEIGDDLNAWQQLIHPEDVENVNHELQVHLTGAMPFYQSEHRLMCKDGTYKWILDRGMVITRNAANQPERIIGTHSDISQTKYTELALEQRVKQFKSLADNIPGVIYEYEFRADGTEGFRYISAAAKTIFDINPADFNNYYHYVHPDDRSMIVANNLQAKNTLQSFYCEARLVIPGRGIAWHSVTSSYSYTSENGSKIFTGFILDITERKNAEDQLKLKEEKYRSIIANMNLGLLEVDKEEKILFANQSFCEMSGYDCEELVNRNPSDIFIQGANQVLMQEKNAARKEGVSDAFEIAVRNKRGQARWWLVSGAPRYDDAGNMVGSIGIHLDITLHKKLEADLIEAREQAEASTRSKEVFLANMSHEIRTPMNAIIGMANQLGKTSLDDRQQFFLETIHSASENLLFIINDILDLSKIEAGKLEVEAISFNPAEVISRTIRILGQRAEEKGLTITPDLSDPLIAPLLIGDPFRLNQVLLNLVSNAIKFTEKGGVKISVEVMNDLLYAQVVRISVHDSGIGMEAQFVHNLFEKFSQEDASITRQYGGTGLGMSISRELVQLMGGQMNVASKKGMGTTISFTIEFQKGIQEGVVELPKMNLDTGILKGKKILVVDDNQMNRLVAATILTNYGAIVSESVNGLEAIDVLVHDLAALVLMDIQMPVMDGVEAIAFIRQKISTSLPVIALTANAIKGDNDKYIEAGMNDYLAKPYQEKELVNMVAFWLLKNANTHPDATDNIPPKDIALYDLSGIQMLSRGNDAFVQKMVRLFIDQTPGHVAAMMQYYHQGNFKAMVDMALKIKQVVDTLEIIPLKTVMISIENYGKQDPCNPLLPALMETVATTIKAVAESLGAVCKIN